MTLTVLEGPGPVRNTPAVGRPAISGTAQAGQTLTASTAGISDADGLTSAVYEYQWLRVVNGDEADIDGETVATYGVMEADVDSQLKVRVSFTDDRDHAESLTSEPTATVQSETNTPAVGQPTISGTAQAGQTLTASTDRHQR